MNTIYKGCPVHYEFYGDGTPLVLLHGFNESAEVWRPLLPLLSDKYRCILIDLPGFGQSSLPQNLTIKYMVDAVSRVISELALLRPIVIGHSMGGYVTLELARNHPELLSAAGLFHSTAFADTEEKMANRQKTLDFLNTHPVETFFKSFVAGLFAPFNRETSLARQTEALINTTRVSSVLAATRAMMERPDRTEYLKSSPLPWLFVSGKHDQLLPVEQISLQASFCRKASFSILENSGHMGMIEEPEKSAAIITNFVQWVNLFPHESLNNPPAESLEKTN